MLALLQEESDSQRGFPSIQVESAVYPITNRKWPAECSLQGSMKGASVTGSHYHKLACQISPFSTIRHTLGPSACSSDLQ